DTGGAIGGKPGVRFFSGVNGRPLLPFPQMAKDSCDREVSYMRVVFSVCCNDAAFVYKVRLYKSKALYAHGRFYGFLYSCRP
ncbi:MAG: hypothetical protein KAR47_05015, partial [Planctomycetes bacterium]|nr:hypothetical protein [Planctomycetota bacterium]